MHLKRCRFRLSLLLFLSTKKLFFFLADFFFKTLDSIVNQPRGIFRGFHGICRKSFFTSSSHSFQSDCIRLTNFRIFAFVDDKSGNAIFATGCYPVGVVVWRRGEAPFSKSTVRGLCGGKIFPHTPIFYARVAGTGSCGSSLPGRGGGSAALLVRLRRPTLHRASRCGRGPSLRCVHLRRTCSLLLCLAQRSSFTSAPRRIPRLLCRAEMSRGIHFHGRPSGLRLYMVGVLGFEPRTSSLSGTRSNQLSYTPIQDYQSLSGCGLVKWWSRRDSNPQHPACKAGALAIELRPRSHVVSPSGILT